MHELVSRVLDQRDLSKARELFSVCNRDIIKDIDQICRKLADIFTARSYITDTNSQSVVEISIARITSAIRENDAIEFCVVHLITLLDQCIKHNVNRVDNSEENPPHAKLASDILSCVFLHYNKSSVMAIAVPVAMKILQKRNRDLVRSTSSYLVLAAINSPKLFSKFGAQILASIGEGNLSLVRLLPHIYTDNKDVIISNVAKILNFFDLYDSSEKTVVLNICTVIADNKAEVLVDHVPKFESFLSYSNSSQILSVLHIFLTLVNTGYAFCLRNGWHNLKQVALNLADQSGRNGSGNVSSNGFLTSGSLLSILLKVMIGIGKLNERMCLDTVDFLICLACKLNCRLIDTLSNDLLPLVELYYGSICNHLMIYDKSFNGNSATATQITKNSVKKLRELCDNIRLANIPSTPNDHRQATLITLLGETKGERILNNNHRDQDDSSNNSLRSHKSSSSLNSSTNRLSGTIADSYTNLLNAPETNIIGQKRTHDRNQRNQAHQFFMLPSTYGGNSFSTTANVIRHEKYPTEAENLDPSQNQDNNGTDHNSSCSSIYYGFRSRSMSNLASPFRSKSSNKAYRAQREKQLEKIRCQLQLGSAVRSSPRTAGSHISDQSLRLLPHERGHQPFVEPQNTNSLYHNPEITPVTTTANAFDSTASRVVTTFNRDASISAKRTGSGNVLMTMTRIYADENNNAPSFKWTPVSTTAATNAWNTMATKDNFRPSLKNFEHIAGSFCSTNPETNNVQIHTIGANFCTAQTEISNHAISKGTDAIKQFCDKHLQKIRFYVNDWSTKYPAPCQCIVEDFGHRNVLRIQFYCQAMGEYCLYKMNPFAFKTKQPIIWLHLMFLHLQARSSIALNSLTESVQKLKTCWELLPQNVTKLKSFTALVTSAFPTSKEQQLIFKELHSATYFDLFSYNQLNRKWCCFPCNNPAKVQHFLQQGDTPVIEGQLKEKKGRWKFFKRWRTRYFTLSGATLFCRASDSDNSNERKPAIDIRTVRSLKSLNGKKRRKDRRSAIPKAFEIFVDDHNSYIFKARDRKDAEEWFQCLQIAVAQVQKERVSPVKMLL